MFWTENVVVGPRRWDFHIWVLILIESDVASSKSPGICWSITTTPVVLLVVPRVIRVVMVVVRLLPRQPLWPPNKVLVELYVIEHVV